MTAEEAGERMSSPELTRWIAWERVYGPLLVHERIDIGLAQVAYVTAKVSGAKVGAWRDFLPVWMRELAGEASVRQGFERLRLMALSKEQGIGEEASD